MVALFALRPFQKYFKKHISYKQLQKLGSLFLVMFLLQLKYSKHARAWTKSMGYFSVYLASVLGILGTVSTLAIKYKLDKKTK